MSKATKNKGGVGDCSSVFAYKNIEVPLLFFRVVGQMSVPTHCHGNGQGSVPLTLSSLYSLVDDLIHPMASLPYGDNSQTFVGGEDCSLMTPASVSSLPDKEENIQF